MTPFRVIMKCSEDNIGGISHKEECSTDVGAEITNIHKSNIFSDKFVSYKLLLTLISDTLIGNN